MVFQILNEAIFPFILIGLGVVTAIACTVITIDYLRNRVRNKYQNASRFKALIKTSRIVEVGIFDSCNNYLGSEVHIEDEVSNEIVVGVLYNC